jgi:hypothetical protein
MWDDDIKMDLKEIEWKDVGCIYLRQENSGGLL